MGNNNSLLKYAGLATQFFIVIAITFYLGLKLDSWLGFTTPLLVWILPLLFIIYSIWKIVQDTNPTKKTK